FTVFHTLTGVNVCGRFLWRGDQCLRLYLSDRPRSGKSNRSRRMELSMHHIPVPNVALRARASAITAVHDFAERAGDARASVSARGFPGSRLDMIDFAVDLDGHRLGLT